MVPLSNTPGLQLEEMTLDSVAPDETDVFLLSSSNFMHKLTSCRVRVTEGNEEK